MSSPGSRGTCLILSPLNAFRWKLGGKVSRKGKQNVTDAPACSDTHWAETLGLQWETAWQSQVHTLRGTSVIL